MKTPRTKKLLLTSALVAPWLALASANGETLDVERSDQGNITFSGASDSQIERLIRQFGATQPWDGAEAGVDTVPARLHRIADDIIRLYTDHHFKQLLTLVNENPDVRAARPEVNQLEAWSYYHSGQAHKAMTRFQALYTLTPSAEHAAGVIYSGMRTAWYTRTWEFAKHHGGPLAEILRPEETAVQGAPKDAVEQTRADFLNGWLRAAVRYEKYSTADKVARLLGFEGVDEVKAEMIVGYGWKAHKAGNFEKSSRYFAQVMTLAASANQIAEARYGYALSLRDEGRLDEADAALASVTPQDARSAALARDITLQRGLAAFEEQDYRTSLGHALAVKSAENEPRSAWMLEGWSLLNLERADEAANVFVAAYRELADEESADGVTASLLALGRRADIAVLASEIEGPLKPPPASASGPTPQSDGETWVMSQGESAFYRGDYAMATAFKPDLAETLAPWLGVSAHYKFRDGDDGLGRLDMIGSKVSFDLTDNTVHLRAQIDVMHLDAKAAPKQPILSGSRAPGGLRPFAPTINDTVFQPSFHIRTEGLWGLEASLGTTPFEGEVHPAITGHIDFVHSRDGARYSAGFHRNSIYESILSISGMRDTVTGTSWGRVVETGLHADLYQPVLDTLAVTASARWGERTGVNVDTNQTRFFNVGAVYSFNAAGFTYLTVGPSFRYTSFDKNRSFHTFGHGGYYSPAEVQNVSLNLNFLTDEDENWIARGAVSLGYEDANNDAATFYPLAPLPGDGFYAASSSQGLAFALEAVGARRLNDVVIAEIGAYGLNAEDYSEVGAFLKLRVSFGKRTKLWRSDLTEDLHRKYH